MKIRFRVTEEDVEELTQQPSIVFVPQWTKAAPGKSKGTTSTSRPDMPTPHLHDNTPSTHLRSSATPTVSTPEMPAVEVVPDRSESIDPRDIYLPAPPPCDLADLDKDGYVRATDRVISYRLSVDLAMALLLSYLRTEAYYHSGGAVLHATWIEAEMPVSRTMVRLFVSGYSQSDGALAVGARAIVEADARSNDLLRDCDPGYMDYVWQEATVIARTRRQR